MALLDESWVVLVPPPARICRNSFKTLHLVVSLLAHLCIEVGRWTVEGPRPRPELPEDNLPEHHRRRIPRLLLQDRGQQQVSWLMHYVVVWASVITSPKGIQVDAWLAVMIAMDLGPLAVAVTRGCLAWTRASSPDLDGALLDLVQATAGTMQRWSPAYLINEAILKAVKGCFYSHMAIIYSFTVAVTSLQTFLVVSIHCSTHHQSQL